MLLVPSTNPGKGALLALFLLFFGFAFADPASAQDLSTLDPNAAAAGHLAIDESGDAYVAWVRAGTGGNPDQGMFCEIPPGGACADPTALPIPLVGSETSLSAVDSVSGAFPILIGGTLYVVEPRYLQDDVIICASTAGGFFGCTDEPRNTGTPSAGPYSNKAEPTEALSDPGADILIGAYNDGLGFSNFGTSTGNFSFNNTGDGVVGGSSLALDSSNDPVEAYWNLSSPPYPLLFYRYDGSGSLGSQSNWTGPTLIAAGYEPHLASGPGGLFLVSADYPSGGSQPSVLDVRKYSGASFGSPTALANDASINLFAGGAIAESSGGRLAVAWPGARSADQAAVMRLFTSSNGGASFTETDIAHLGSGYADGSNAQLAVGDSGQGWLTYRDAAGLQLADLTPIAPAASKSTNAPPSENGRGNPRQAKRKLKCKKGFHKRRVHGKLKCAKAHKKKHRSHRRPRLG
jgi:hypothetical protein